MNQMPPKCHCPDCGTPLTLTEDSISRMLSNVNVFLGKCGNGHSWEVIEDLTDGGRVQITQLLDGDHKDGEESEDEELSGVEIDLAQQWN